MALGRLAVDLWMAGVVLSLACIGLFGVTGAGAALLTVTRARRQARRPRELGQLARWYSVAELAEIDEALDGILADEIGARPRPRGRPGRRLRLGSRSTRGE